MLSDFVQRRNTCSPTIHVLYKSLYYRSGFPKAHRQDLLTNGPQRYTVHAIAARMIYLHLSDTGPEGHVQKGYVNYAVCLVMNIILY